MPSAWFSTDSAIETFMFIFLADASQRPLMPISPGGKTSVGVSSLSDSSERRDCKVIRS
jgi:hypothetical protein